MSAPVDIDVDGEPVGIVAGEGKFVLFMPPAVRARSREDVESLVRHRRECGAFDDRVFRLLFGYSLEPAPVPLPLVRPIAPWHPFADAPRGEP